MKIIKIPSVKSENCLVTLKFHDDNKGKINAVDLDCQTPVFKAGLQVCIDEHSLKSFIQDIKVVEKERKGMCQFYDEWFFSLTIRSTDSLGHFRVEIWIQDIRDSAGTDQSDTLKFGYEIEPSLLISLADELSTLDQNTDDLKN